MSGKDQSASQESPCSESKMLDRSGAMAFPTAAKDSANVDGLDPSIGTLEIVRRFCEFSLK